MKYLRKFFESIDDDFENQLKDFCETNLAYLLDEGYKLTYKSYIDDYSDEYYIIYLSCFTRQNSKKFFTWEDIKDYYLPFITRLSKEYEIPEDRYDPITIKRDTADSIALPILYLSLIELEANDSPELIEEISVTIRL